MDDGFGARVIFEFSNGIQITETITTTWLIMAVLIILSILATRNLERIPKGKQNFLELLVDGLYKFTGQTMGKDKTGFTPYMGTILIFILIANLSGLLGFRPPTADVNTTIGLALITFFMIHFFGMRSKGVGTYLKGFLDPIPFLLPLNVIGELATPISLSFRLFGNIVGGVIIMSLLYGGLTALGVKLGINLPVFTTAIPVPFHFYFDLFSGVLQSFIFTMLTMVFVSNAMD